MSSSAPETTSIWRRTGAPPEFAPLPGSTSAEVVVIGAGVTGLTTALLLAGSGVQVTLVEAGGIGAGTTGDTTGKVTSQHGMIYRDLIERHGEATARAYGQVNEQAIEQIEALCRTHDIDAGFQRRAAYLYTTAQDRVAELHAEFDAARRLGLPANWVDDPELPFDVAGAVRFDDQAQLHPMDYLAGLAATLASMPGATVHTSTRAVNVTETDGRVVVTTERGEITADHAVLATLSPITDRGFEFARLSPVRAYGISVAVDDPGFEGMYLSVDDPSWSLRRYDDGRTRQVVVVGGSHPVGRAPKEDGRFELLERFAREHFEVREVTARWSAQDHTAMDRLPFIGRTAFSGHIHVATGFQKWGLSAGTFAAHLLTDLITGRDNPHAATFAPTRLEVTAEATSFLKHNLEVARMFVEDRVRPEAASIDDIPPGQGATVRLGADLVAVSKDHEGNVTRRSATCTHLGCVVRWNRAEASWDCGCHGSRFDREGRVLNGPATTPLRER